MTSSMSLRRSVMFAGLGNIIYLGCQYGILMVIAKLGNPTLVGQFSLAMAITAPVILFSQMQLRQALVTDANNEYQFSDYFSFRAFSSLVALLVIIGILIVSQYSAEFGWLLLVVGLAKACESQSDIIHGYLQKNERMDLIATSLTIKGILSFVVFSLILWRTKNIVSASIGMAAVWAIVLLGYDMVKQRIIEPKRLNIFYLKLDTASRLFVITISLAIASGICSFTGNLPRYFLETFHGVKAVALFSVATAPMSLVSLLCGAISQATIARAATYFQQGELEAFKRLSVKIAVLQIAVAVIAAIIFTFVGPLLFSVFFTKDYISAAPILTILSISSAVSALNVWGSTIIQASRKFNLQLAVIAWQLLIQLVAGFYLISGYGPIGAGWADLIKNIAGAAFFHIGGWLIYKSRQRQLSETCCDSIK